MSSLKPSKNNIAKNRSFAGATNLSQIATRRKTDRLSRRFKAVGAYPTELQNVRDHLVLRRFLEVISHIHVRLDLSKQIGDKDMKIETALERALPLEAVTKTEDEEQTPKAAVIRRDKTKNLVEGVTKRVNQLSVDDKQLKNRQNQSRERSSSRGRCGENKKDTF